MARATNGPSGRAGRGGAAHVVTLGEVAARAEVSLATASRVLNSTDRKVGEELRARVEQAVAELGYTPNMHARALASSTSSLVGLLVQDLIDPYFSTIADAIIHAADARELFVTVGSTFHDHERELSYFRALRAQHVSAVVLVGTRTTHRVREQRMADAIADFRAAGGHIASVSEARLGAPAVVPPNHAGARALAIALAEAGHRRFAILGGQKELLAARDREAGFRAGLRTQGIELAPEATIRGSFDRDGGHAAIAQLTKRELQGRCVFAVNDLMALGAMAALRERGLRVPQDVSVAGFGDIPTLRDLVPALSTVRLPLRSMGELALALALGNDDGAPPKVDVEWDVLLRDSTRRAG